MTPLEKAVRATLHPAAEPSRVEVAKAAKLITAFLEAAAEDADLCRRVGDAAYDKAEISWGASGYDAILALKEAVNAG